ncbi:hypothetical protein WA026_018448 [Henosepilachna vigintioctopunctata]|uniref:Obscurin n=1 Tax=Henosepilachna vigintioctopunctata TaxID=420089 RepID=A0AAW1UWD1_9CUCU
MRVIICEGTSYDLIVEADTSLTSLRRKWCARNCSISDFLNYLVKYQDVPGPISEKIFVSDSGRNWISLSWGKPEYRAAPVIAYKIEAWLRGGEGARWKELGVSPINSYDAFNLKPGGQYQFRITPRNRYGWGEMVQSDIITVGDATGLPEFTNILPGQLKALLGSRVSLECELRVGSPPIIRWYKNSEEIEENANERISMSYLNNTCILTISGLRYSDSGRYICEATNKAGRVSTFCRLLVVDEVIVSPTDTKLKLSQVETKSSPPQFSMRLRDRRVQVTYPVRLTCQVEAIPSPKISWKKDGADIETNGRYNFWTDNKFHTLEISKTALNDSGIYTVIAQNNHGTVSCCCNLVVDQGIRAYVSPSFKTELEPSSVLLKEGEEIRLSGKIEAYPIVGVVWYRDGMRLRPSRKSVMTLSYDGRVELSVANVTFKDAGVYTCIASNEVGSAESTARVEVKAVEELDGCVLSTPEKTEMYSQQPKFLKKPRSTEAYEGDNIVILCEIIGDPEPDVIWLRDFLKFHTGSLGIEIYFNFES